MREAALAAGRAPDAIELVAVSKFQPREAVLEALAAGQTVFGENRVQEANGKFADLRADHPALRLHLIGAIQTNKAGDAVRIADRIETLDRPRLADAIETAAGRQGRLPSLLVQVNIGEEPQKAGVAPVEADAFIEDCQRRFGAALAGLMAIPPNGLDPAPFFSRLAAMAAAHGLPELSMGMSDDFPLAIRHGATSVRVGSAIFGARPEPTPGSALHMPRNAIA
ncbi:YggS family pyridoxal phosphate-dependent enzyme [Acetobacteraceae bacterium KSS8]|uniref:Pyridoxal phosphate homeostasis protein n=2 Tax=Endosaccharibacter trunci TaxID=2812733 RepID=A0ABT1W8M5_9PROT|nr:YggS family pyridoxal phosphate-dependent enzyme [Acetobacteraceae bacterium KSS8]